MKIPYRDDKHHVRKNEGCNYLEILDSRWGVEEGNLGNGLRDYLPNWDFPPEERKIWDKWCNGVLREFMR
jgi:hypothetical protein